MKVIIDLEQFKKPENSEEENAEEKRVFLDGLTLRDIEYKEVEK